MPPTTSTRGLWARLDDLSARVSGSPSTQRLIPLLPEAALGSVLGFAVFTVEIRSLPFWFMVVSYSIAIPAALLLRGVALSTWRERTTVGGVAVLVLGWVVALLAGPEARGPTITLVLWWLALLPLALCRWRRQVFAWVLPFGLGCALWVWIEGVAGVLRSRGGVDSPNVAGGFLALCTVYLATSRFRWVTPFMLAAIGFTGSRLATVVVLGTLIGMAAVQLLPRRFVILSLVGAALLLPWSGQVLHSYRLLDQAPPQEITAIRNEIAARLSPPTPLVPPALFTPAANPSPSKVSWLVPQGFQGAAGGHSVPVRLFYELGIVPLVVWLGLIIRRLWRRPRDVSWWLMATFVGLCTLEYYPMMPLVISPWFPVLLGEAISRDPMAEPTSSRCASPPTSANYEARHPDR